MKTVKVAILGLGTVGSGVYKLIQKRADVMEKTIGAQMEVKKILVRNINKKREGVDASLLTDNWNDIIEDEEIQIVIEVMGGIEPAKKFVFRFIDKADEEKPVVTDYKTTLQEIVQRNPEEAVEYVLVGESGPDHNKTFSVEVHLNSNVIGHGSGRSKKIAEQAAAKEALELMGLKA